MTDYKQAPRRSQRQIELRANNRYTSFVNLLRDEEPDIEEDSASSSSSSSSSCGPDTNVPNSSTSVGAEPENTTPVSPSRSKDDSSDASSEFEITPEIRETLLKIQSQGHPFGLYSAILIAQDWWDKVKLVWDFRDEFNDEGTLHEMQRWDIISRIISLAELDLSCKYNFGDNYDMFWVRSSRRGNIATIVQPYLAALVYRGQKLVDSDQTTMIIADREGRPFAGFTEILQTSDVLSDPMIKNMTEEEVKERGHPVRFF
ncbi:hypothetical protein K470DRAFT_266647 [Piedraia hortae CBS 480.64]|uniref:Uncharacterized protein n=1 Tax=Piedraia hortae CBS 480.64 TaxID=1314780 RepID=A0A6A7BQX6_9PEZI|nr:hypothetical protein K470DRAFT_266647 [Piedraia hortae CBS 480.64]